RRGAVGRREAGNIPHQRSNGGRQRTSSGHKNGHSRSDQLMDRSAKYLKSLVGAPRFELGTSCAQGRRATRLRYAPTSSALLILKHFLTLLQSELLPIRPSWRA